MVDFAGYVGDAWARLDEVAPLALVPLLSSLASVPNVVRVATFEGTHVGVTFRFPTAVIDLWTFVSLPAGDGSVVAGALRALPVVVPVRAVLAAALLGSLQQYRESGSFEVATGLRRHFVPMLGYVLLATSLGLLVAGAALSGGVGVVLVALPFFLALAYLFYATPYLLVIRDAGLLDALRGSYGHAVAGGAYASFGLRYLGAVALGSILATAVVVNLGIAGVVLGAILAAPVGLALGLATLEFVADLDRGAVGSA